jgi:predicted kinase
MKDCNQPTKYHPEGSVYNHTLLVLDQAVRACRIDLFEACAWHDVGKIGTRMEQDGKITFYGHELLSLHEYTLHNGPLTDNTNNVISQHMRAHLYLNGKMSNPNKRKTFENNTFFQDIMKFAEYDDAGRDIGQHVILTVGISGCGKSTWVTQQQGYTVICPDQLRYQITGNISDQSKNGEVWKEVYRLVDVAIANKENAIVDSTMAKTSDRRQMLNYIRERGAEVLYKTFAINPIDACDRVKNDVTSGKNRSNTPHDIILKQYNSLNEFRDLETENYLTKE